MLHTDLMFGSSMAAFLAAFWLLASMLLNIDTTTPNLFHAALTLFMLATSYFLSSYRSMQAELDAARTDAAEERVSMQAELDAARTDAAGMQAELDVARTELEETELDKLRWRDLANDTKNRLYRAMYASGSGRWKAYM